MRDLESVITSNHGVCHAWRETPFLEPLFSCMKLAEGLHTNKVLEELHLNRKCIHMQGPEEFSREY